MENKALENILSKTGKVRRVHTKEFPASDLYMAHNYVEEFKMHLFKLKYLFSEEKEKELDIVFRETVLNSASACKEREEKKITVTAYYCINGVVFEIKDQGPGFDYKKRLAMLKNKSLPPRESLLERGLNGGHGLFSLKRFTDYFKYSDGGRTVYFAFNLEKIKKHQ